MKISFLYYIPMIAIIILAGEYLGDRIPEEEGPPIEVYFSYEDNLTEVFTSLIMEHDEIRCALYDLKLPEVMIGLQEKEALVITDDDNPLPWGMTDKGTALMHNKFCIFDSEVIWTGSFNPTPNGAYRNDNDMVVIHSRLLAKNYLSEFDEMLKESFGEGSAVPDPTILFNGQRIETLFCPEDGCKEKVLSELSKAEHSVYFMAFSFTDRDIAGALIALSEKIEVKGIMEKQRFGSEYNVYRLFSEKGMDVIPDQNRYVFHHKAYIIDNRTVITGSYNPTGNGNEKNDENILVIHDPDVAQRYYRYFSERFRNFSYNVS